MMLSNNQHIAILIFIVCNFFSSAFSDVKCKETVDITNGVKVGTNIIKDGLTFTENDYIIESNIIKGCICQVKKCLRRCCLSNQTLFQREDNEIICQGSTASENVYEDLKPVINQTVSLFNIITVSERDVCLEQDAYTVFVDTNLEISYSGVLEWDDDVYEYGEFCVANLDGRLGVLICVVPDTQINKLVYCVGMIISMPFLLATFLVYAILPDRNIHQRALMFYVLTLLISYMLLVTINLSENIPSPGCEIFGYATLYFFMVSFFWMNVICFDIWYTFSGGRGFVGSKRTSERKRLLLYSLYAFGVPLLVALLVLLLQSKVLSENSEHNPGIGIKKCFLGDGWPNLWYFYLEAGLLVIINIIFFTLTALKIRQVKKETSMLKHNDSQRHSYEKDKQKFNLYVKLLFAMGVNWSMEVISWLVNWRTSNNIQYIWWATDFFNAVYGVFIFFMFVFKKKIWKLLQRRYYTFVGKPHLAHTMTTTNATRTSHYSSTNYSTADTTVTDRTNVSNGNGRGRPEEMALRTVT